jgi:hypothetical protein
MVKVVTALLRAKNAFFSPCNCRLHNNMLCFISLWNDCEVRSYNSDHLALGREKQTIILSANRVDHDKSSLLCPLQRSSATVSSNNSMNMFSGNKKKGDKSKKKEKKGSNNKGTKSDARPRARQQQQPVVGQDQFIQNMVNEWEALNAKLSKIPEVEWENLRDEMTEVTERLYDMKDYSDDYRKEDVLSFKTNEFTPMMDEARDITREATVVYLNDVDGRGDLLDDWRYCKAYVDERRTLSKALQNLVEEIKTGNTKCEQLEKSGLIMSAEAIRDHLDELEEIVNKVKPLVEKADLKDYVTIRNQEEKFIQRCNKAMNELNGYGFETWAYFKSDLDVLQEHMTRLQKKFDSKEEADEHIAATEQALKVVKKEIKKIRQPNEEELGETQDKSGISRKEGKKLKKGWMTKNKGKSKKSS